MRLKIIRRTWSGSSVNGKGQESAVSSMEWNSVKRKRRAEARNEDFATNATHENTSVHVRRYEVIC